MQIYEYGKQKDYVTKIFLTALVSLCLIVSFILWITPLGTLLYESGIDSIVSHFTTNIQQKTALASFYTGLIGGLFFLTIPLEGIFLGLVGESIIQPIVGIIAGISISYTINYIIGFNVGALTKRLVGPQKFYWLKANLNTYGSGLIIVCNIIPMVGQSFTALLGVVKYNKTRLALYTLIAQVVKYGGLVLIL